MIRYMEQARLLSVIIAADKIEIGFIRHKRSWNGNVFISGNINAVGIIHFIISALCNRIFADRALAVIQHCGYIRRHDGRRIFINGISRICPPQKGLRQAAIVEYPGVNFDINRIWIESDFR